ncbi:MAG: ribosomal protein S18-alanine N-acetyltransferase [Christensenellaceae bacterium]|jgi:ribosomal-protein-alanine N-acetyltransferase|nr:ribosomal protein S18-alanine N-acetyltransferase [Christensenellaceae bacterium]
MLKILRAQDEYFARMYEIHKECFDEAMSEPLFLEEITHDSRMYFVILVEGQVEAYAGAWNTGEDYSVISIATSKAHQRQGLAGKLLERLITDAERKKIKALSLEVNTKNKPAIDLYRKMGFIITNTRKKYYKNGDDAYVMWLYK